MKVRDIFEKDPERKILPVVKIDVHEEPIISTEVEEYVVTDQIREAFNEIIDYFLEARTGRPVPVCAWISGFFGSGKSHFLKMLGYVLTNRKVRLSNGAEVGVAEYFGQKHGIKGTHILAKELKTKALFVYMLDFDRTKEKDLSRFLYRVLLRELGFSEIFWVAEVERMLKRKGLWEKFVEFVEKEEGMAWNEVRQIETRVRSVLIRGLVNVDPKAFPSTQIAEAAIRDAEKEFTMNPERLAKRLLEEAETIDKNNGRLILLLDEVGLYVGRGIDRLTELNALAENIEKIGKGKVWIFATAQEAIEQVLPQIEGRRAELEWIRDRFRIKIALRPENISTVVNKRLLKKKEKSPALQELEELYKKYEGTLKMSVLLKDPARDPYGVYKNLAYERFVESYPLMPYHVPLMIRIFGVLRSRGRISPELTGRERAVLQVARWALLNLLDKNIGALVTFDLIYDAISEELKAVRSEYQALIESEIGKIGEVDGLRVDSVAKALFLLQQVSEEIPCTIENVAAVLYPGLGVDQRSHEERVAACLKKLVEGKWVICEEGKYRFLSEIERTFEQDVEGQVVRAADKERLVLDIAKESLKDFRKFNYKKIRVFDVHLWVDDKEITTVGHLKLKFYTPYWTVGREEPIDELYNKSIAEPDTIFWVCESNDLFESKIKRVIAIEQTLNERERRTPSLEELRELEKYRREVELIRGDELPNILMSSARSGTVLYRGDEFELSGKETLRDVFNRFMKTLADDLFTEFGVAGFRVEKDKYIGEILRWKAGRLPSIYYDLKLVDKDGNISIGAPVADYVLREIKRRVKIGEECSGLVLEQHFGAPPFGWDSSVLRLTLATLFKNGNLQVESMGRTYVSPDERGSHEVFTNVRLFRKARFYLGATVSSEQRNNARRFISEIFGRSVGITLEDIAKELDEIVDEYTGHINNLRVKEGFHQLPYVDVMEKFEEALRRIKQQPSYTLKILTFLDEGTLQPIKDGISVFSALKEFVDSGKLDLYVSIRRFVDKHLEELLQFCGELRSTSEELKRMIESPELLDEWGEVYEKFVFLKEEYVKEYRRLHSERQERAEKAIEELESWGKSKGLDVKVVKDALVPLNKFLCKGGKEGKFDDRSFVCTLCGASLATLSYNIEAVGKEYDKIKQKLVSILVKKEEKGEKPVFPAKWSEEREVGSVDDFKRFMDEALDVVRYGIERKKKVKVRVEVERP